MQSRSRVESNARYVQSKLNFVDLAGSERLSKTQVRSALIGSLSLYSAVIGQNVILLSWLVKVKHFVQD